MESPFNGGSNVIPLVVVESVRQNIRDLECVRLVGLSVDAVSDVVAASVASNNALLLHRFFVGGEWKDLLAWTDG